MDVLVYEIYCNKCGWVLLPSDNVKIILSLNTDEYIFTGECPECKKEFVNKRKAFK